MDEKNASETPLFKALLVPHRSLGRTGFFVLMGGIIFIWLSITLIFWRLGAWPVIGFFGLDVLALYIAFRVNYRAARAREEISLSRTNLHIRKVPPSGRAEEHSFNPLWARFRVRRHTEIGITDMAVEMREKRVLVGSFLNPDDRESFAKAFGRALATVKAR
ncbi:MULTISPECIES: DUF2244 domain-containing protein [Chelativorans]|jgi:uncharacterized membrane protein|uniref:DUF2244 domain-containing protein n=1 Tax=Chelativorans sp. (strain BNC1) TaxID=266779 RepID=Q11CD8_CHESB|nr:MULTISPECIES: DUF2244 domain-containing protein [Chelativorans]